MGKTLLNREDKVYQLNNNKIEWVKTFLETFSDRVVIFYQYTHQMDQLYNEIKKMKRNVARYNADFKEKDIFMENKDCVILVQYKSGGTGIDWLKNSYVGIFYSLPDSYIEYYQAKGRIDRNGQTKKPLFYVLTSTGSNSVDKLNYEALKNKQDFNDEYFQNCFGGK
jgi:superfamily II DNA helicase RecQ